MRKFGLIGYPLGHSFSKKYFSEKFEREKISDAVYELFPLQSIGLLPDLVRDQKELTGLNVTIPYKEQVLSYLDEIDSDAAEVGAVNVIKITRHGGKPWLHGFNSDITGITDTLSPCFNTRLRSAIVLGTGGSSKAVCWVLEKAGIKIISVSRQKKAGTVTYDELSDELIMKAGLIVNTTPVGMFPATGDKPVIPYDKLDSRHILFDLVYNPEKTAFLRMGEERGCMVITGLKMLYSQAERSWEIWNNDVLF